LPDRNFWPELDGMAPRSQDTPFEQFDLFSGAGAAPPWAEAAWMDWAPLDPARLSNAELIAVLPRARQAEAPALTAEAARRALTDAIPALEALCRRFAGFGLDREVTEQVAALSGLASLGGAAARAAVARLIVADSVRGPGLRVALEAAADLGCRLPPERVAACLRDNNPAVRQAACRCAQGGVLKVGVLKVGVPKARRR
jgi:hypothetical protein